MGQSKAVRAVTGRMPRLTSSMNRRPIRVLPAGEAGHAGAEGATAPETLRQKDRVGFERWKAAAQRRSPKEQRERKRPESLRPMDSGGAGVGDVSMRVP